MLSDIDLVEGVNRRGDMLKTIVSGCQMGADIAGIDAAIDNGFTYGGWVPRGRKTDAGPLSDKYIVQEMLSTGYPQCTEKNVIDSDGTVIFTHCQLSDGIDLPRKYAIEHGKPWLHIDLTEKSRERAVDMLMVFALHHRIATLNVAGTCASKDPEIYQAVYEIVNDFLKRIRHR